MGCVDDISHYNLEYGGFSRNFRSCQGSDRPRLRASHAGRRHPPCCEPGSAWWPCPASRNEDFTEKLMGKSPMDRSFHERILDEWGMFHCMSKIWMNLWEWSNSNSIYGYSLMGSNFNISYIPGGCFRNKGPEVLMFHYFSGINTSVNHTLFSSPFWVLSELLHYFFEDSWLPAWLPSGSFGTQRQQLEHRTMAVWPRPCLDRPLLRRLDGIVFCTGQGHQNLQR